MYIFGIDIGGTNIKIGLFNEENELIDKFQIKTNLDDNGKNIFNDISIAIKKHMMLKKINPLTIQGFGFGIPGVVKDNFVTFCPNLGWKNIDIKKEFIKYYEKDVLVVSANDANMAAIGEYNQCEEKIDSCIFITIGTGVGGGVIINNKIIEGFCGASGEIGHISVSNNHNFKCNCGLYNCLETLSSASGIMRLTDIYLKDYPNSCLSGKQYKMSDIITGALSNDELCLKVIDESMYYLASTICNIGVIINPEVFIIGGGVSNAGNIIIQNIKKHFVELAHKDLKNTKIRLATLKNDAGIYGANYLVKELIKE